MPVCYSFFNKEFTRYAERAPSNSEVALVLKELCDSLESVAFKEHPDPEAKRLSIVDPKGFKTSGSRATSTSTKVDHSAHVQRSKMVEHFQSDVLDRKPKSAKQKSGIDVLSDIKRGITLKPASTFWTLNTQKEQISF